MERMNGKTPTGSQLHDILNYYEPREKQRQMFVQLGRTKANTPALC